MLYKMKYSYPQLYRGKMKQMFLPDTELINQAFIINKAFWSTVSHSAFIVKNHKMWPDIKRYYIQKSESQHIGIAKEFLWYA